MIARWLTALSALAAVALGTTTVGAQCDVPDAGDPDDLGTLRDTFPADEGLDVPTDSPVRLRFSGYVPTGASLCVSAVGRMGCLPGDVTVVRDELVWTSTAGPFEPYNNYRIDYRDPLTSFPIRFRAGRGPSAGAPPFAGIRGASARAVNGDGCDAGAFDVTVRFNRVTFDAALGTPWPESDVEYVIYATRGSTVAGPRERDRVRLQSSGSTTDAQAQRTFRLSAAEASGPVCFSVQALDPLGRVTANTAEACVDPSQGNYFQGCSVSPGAQPTRSSALALAALAWVFAGRRRQRTLVSTRRLTVGSVAL